MELSRLIYISDATQRMTDDELRVLVKKASFKNETRGITGVLISGGQYFLQLLEGDPARVSSLFKHISLDPRHSNIRALLHKNADRRLFSEWGMQLISTDRELDRDQIDKALLRLRLTPETEASEALTLIEEFRQQLIKNVA